DVPPPLEDVVLDLAGEGGVQPDQVRGRNRVRLRELRVRDRRRANIHVQNINVDERRVGRGLASRRPGSPDRESKGKFGHPCKGPSNRLPLTILPPRHTIEARKSRSNFKRSSNRRYQK